MGNSITHDMQHAQDRKASEKKSQAKQIEVFAAGLAEMAAAINFLLQIVQVEVPISSPLSIKPDIKRMPAGEYFLMLKQQQQMLVTAQQEPLESTRFGGEMGPGQTLVASTSADEPAANPAINPHLGRN